MKGVLCRAIAETRTSGGFLLFAYVLMHDHMHVLTNKPNSTSEVLRLLKGITARRVIDYLKEKNYLASLAKLQHQEQERNYRYSLWQTEKNVLPIFSEGMFMQKVNYVQLGPLRKGIATSSHRQAQPGNSYFLISWSLFSVLHAWLGPPRRRCCYALP
jgi:REP element-mobilizing transposase RayT